jgi:aminomethyltransferase
MTLHTAYVMFFLLPFLSSMTSSSNSLKRTPLYDSHLASNAKMVDFGGWEMPLHYGSQVEEHHHVRRDAGMFDVSHMCATDISGGSNKAFLQKLLANDVAKLEQKGKALYSAMLNDAGGVIDDLIVYRIGGGLDTHATPDYRVVLNASTAEKDLSHMQKIAASMSEIEDPIIITPRRDFVMIAVQGSNAREKVWTAFPGWRELTESLPPFHGAVVSGSAFVARTGYTGEDGFEIMYPATDAKYLWQKLLDAGVAPCGLGARDTLRLEAGMNLYGNDMDETVSPLDAGLAWTVDMKTDRHFIGRAALKQSGQRARFFGLKLLERGVLRAHMKIIMPHGEGEITSGTHSPTLGFSIAMARLPMNVAIGDTVQVDIRGKLLPALVVKMPFVRNGKALIS